jgi:cell division protein FtsZ
MGSSVSSGENRAKEAIVAALDSPLLNDNKITGAKTYCCLSFLEPMKLQLKLRNQ